jgi:hypothetical protein
MRAAIHWCSPVRMARAARITPDSLGLQPAPYVYKLVDISEKHAD